MKKHRLLGWVVMIAMLMGMLPAEALAAPVTAQKKEYTVSCIDQQSGEPIEGTYKISVSTDRQTVSALAPKIAGYQFQTAQYRLDSDPTQEAQNITELQIKQAGNTVHLMAGAKDIEGAQIILTYAAYDMDDITNASTIKNWRRSIEVGFPDAEVRYPQTQNVNGSGTQAMLDWSWKDIEDIGTSVTDPLDVWDALRDTHYLNYFLKEGEKLPYPAATWKCGNSPSLRRFTGEYTVPDGFTTRDTFRLRTVNQAAADKNILPINDDIFIFIYQKGETITDDNFMDYLAFWSGTSTREAFGTVTSNGRPGTVAYQGSKSASPVTDGWYCEADYDNIGSKMFVNYPDAKAGTEFLIDVFCFDNSKRSGGGMEMLTIDAERTSEYAATIRYWKDAVGDSSADENYLGAESKKGLHLEQAVTLSQEELNRYKPAERYYSGGVQQNAPYIVKGDNGFIDVVYTYTGATVKYDLNLPQGVKAPDSVKAPADDTVEKGQKYTIPEDKEQPKGLTQNYFDIGDKRYSFKVWAKSSTDQTKVTSVKVDKDPTFLYGIWETGEIPVEVQFVAGEHGTIATGKGNYIGHTGQKVSEIVGSSVPTVTVNDDQWEFVGWFQDENPYQTMQDTKVVHNQNSPLVFKAKYEQLNASMELKKEAQNTADRAAARIGDTIQYTVTVQNTGKAPLTNVKLSDTLFEKATNLKVNGNAETLDGNKGFTIPKLSVGTSAIVTYGYTVTEDDELKHEVNNLVTATADQVGEKTAETRTSVEQRQEIKLQYAFEQVNGLNTSFPFTAQPLLVTRKYAGETIDASDFADALAQIAAKYPAGISGAGSQFNRFGESVTSTIGTYTVSASAKENNFAIKFPLDRHTLTYHPGTNGTLAPASGAVGGKLENGSVVFTVPYGAVPDQWFTGDNGTLGVAKTAAEGFVFDGWDSPFDLSQPVTQDLETTAKWRSRTAVDDHYMVIIYQNGVEIDRRNDFPLSFEPGEGAAAATLTLDADKLLQQEQAEGKASQGYKFGRYTTEGAEGEITDPTHTFAIVNGTTIHVYYVPYDLAVWHVRDGAPAIFDQKQSVPTLTAPATAAANAGIFGLSRMHYGSTEVAINGTKDEANAYTDTVAVPVDSGSFSITFHYYRTSGGGNHNGGSNGGGGNGGTEIEDEEIPLAPGLNKDDHFAYVVGYPDGTVRPDANIDRQETATIFFRLMQDSSRMENWSKTNPFKDVKASQWSNNAISTMSAAGILKGYEDGTFRPSAPITRGEFAAIAARFDSALYVGSDLFSDIAGHWAAPYINRAAQKGWIKGYEDGTFKPDQYITRAEAMTLVNAVLDRRVHADALLDGAVSWPDNPKDAWHYEAVQEATNSHNYDRENPTEFETWTELTPARDWTQLEKQWSVAAALPA